MKDRGLGRLTEQEVQVYLAGLYTIQAKLSYIFEVVEEVFLASTGAASRAEYGRHGRALVALMYGGDSPQVPSSTSPNPLTLHCRYSCGRSERGARAVMPS